MILNNNLIGQAMFLILFILALLFYLERTIFLDPCYAVFNILYYRDYVSEAGRYAAVIPQTLALQGMKMELPLKVILGLYSLSFILLYYLVFLVIAYGFRLDRLALAVPLVLLLGVKYSFFWISTETHQALIYTILFYAFLTWSLRFKPGILFWAIRLIVATGILFLCFYSHPISLFTVLFVLGFFVIDNKLWLKPDGYVLASIIVALALFKYFTSSSTGYESFYFKGFGEFFERIGYVFHSESLKFIKTNILNIYLFSMILFLVTAGWYVVKKQYLTLGYYLVSIVVMVLVLFTTFDIWYYPFIQEKNLMGLNILLVIPFLKNVEFNTERRKMITQWFLILVFVAGVNHVVDASWFYKDRLGYIKELVTIGRKYPEKKFILPETVVDRNRLNVYWGLAPESLVLSSLDGPDSSLTMYINDSYGRIKEGTKLDDSLLLICAPWAQDLEIRRLNRNYFNLEHSAYRTLSEKDMVQGSDISFYTNRFDDISFKAGNDSCRKDSTGNSWFLLTSEFSPGFYGKYSEMSKYPAIMITAQVRVFPLEAVDPKWLSLVISREQDNVVLEYYHGGVLPPDSLEPGRWNTLTVSGIVRSSDPKDQLKVYVWNPGRKKTGMDDMEISYRLTN